MGTLRKPKETPILETERLFLRKFRMEDAEAVFAYASNEDTARFVSWEAHRTLDDTRRFLQWELDRYQAGQTSEWAVMEKADGRIIGSIGVVDYQEQHRSCEIGYALGREYWGQGIVAEALERVLRYLFEECDMNRIHAVCCEENLASARVLEKCGFACEGLQRQSVRMKGRFWNMRMYGLLREEWMAGHPPTEQVQDKVLIEEVAPGDLPAILMLQREAYASEAEIYGYAIAPMTQTLEDIQASFSGLAFLKAVLNGSIVGSIRARIAENTCFIGRLIVAPAYQHQGIGRRLLSTMEALHPGLRFELFTGHLSQRNLAMYEKMGYVPFKTVRIGDRESLVYLEKPPAVRP